MNQIDRSRPVSAARQTGTTLILALVLLLLEELFSGSPLLGPFALHWQLPVGAILLAVVLFAPRGIAGAFAKKPQ